MADKHDRGQLSHEYTLISVGALAALTATAVDLKIDQNREQGCRINFMKAAMRYEAKTGNEGPLEVGFSVGLGGSEIGTAFAADPQKFEDPSSSEEGNRKVYPVWVIGFDVTALAQEQRALPKVDIGIPRWTVEEGENLSAFVYNHDSSALTSGTAVRVWTTTYTRWLRD